MNEQYKVVALIGKSGAGKDTILTNFFATLSAQHKFNKIILTTTRPPRDGEENGINYHFVTKEVMTEKILNQEMVSVKQYRQWFYGVAEQSFSKDKINVGCFSPEEVTDLLLDDRFSVCLIYIDVPDNVRLERSIKRTPNMCQEICRRFLADTEDFEKAALNYDYVIPNVTQEDLFWATDAIYGYACAFFNLLPKPEIMTGPIIF